MRLDIGGVEDCVSFKGLRSFVGLMWLVWVCLKRLLELGTVFDVL